MIDPAILLTLTEMPVPPEPSRMVEERLWLSKAGAQAQKIATRLGDQYGSAADAWMADLATLRSRYELLPSESETPTVLQRLDEAIGDTEDLAGRRTGWRARFAKRRKRAAKDEAGLDPSAAAVSRAIAARLLAIDDRIIEGLLEHALFLRAVRAERTPRTSEAPIFDDPEALDRHLRHALA